MKGFGRRLFAKVTAPSPIGRTGGASVVLLLSLLFAACGDSQTFRLTGEIENLREADFYVYATDGSLSQLDTIHIREGRLDWSIPLTSEATLHVVYPNLSEQVIFARPGDHVRLRGDASQLRAISIKGNPENNALTEFRLKHLQTPTDSLHRAIRAYIKEHPDSRVSSHLQRQLTRDRASSSRLRVGQQLPPIVLPPDSVGGDTLRILPTDSAGRPVLLFFWATWKSGSRDAIKDIRRILRQTEKLPRSKRLHPISISLDQDDRQYAYSLRADTIDFDRRRYREIWDAPICQQLAIQNIPYYILADSKRYIVALGTDWEKDIKEHVNTLTR